MVRRAKVQPGSGNIFADLGLPDAKAHLLKAQIVSRFSPSPRAAGSLPPVEHAPGMFEPSVRRTLGMAARG